MARTRGARNSDFAQQRELLISKLRDRLARRGGSSCSLRELALAAGVSVATLRHYFTDRPGVVRAVLEGGRVRGADHLTRTRQAAEGSDPEASVHASLQAVVQGWHHGLGALHTVGLIEGLKSDAAGLSYLVDILEPALRALEQRLETHIERGEMREVDTRHAALWLLSPILIALLHQNELGGRACRPLDLGALVTEQARMFADLYRPAADRERVNVGAW